MIDFSLRLEQQETDKTHVEVKCFDKILFKRGCKGFLKKGRTCLLYDEVKFVPF